MHSPYRHKPTFPRRRATKLTLVCTWLLVISAMNLSCSNSEAEQVGPDVGGSDATHDATTDSVEDDGTADTSDTDSIDGSTMPDSMANDTTGGDAGDGLARECPDSAWTDERGVEQYCLCTQRRHGGTDTQCCARNEPYDCTMGFSSPGETRSSWTPSGGRCWERGEERPRPPERYSTPCPWVDDPFN